jgi:hypothetical protein
VIVSQDDLITAIPVTQPATSKTHGRAHHREHTKQALIALYGPNGPEGVPEEERLDEVKKWLSENPRNQLNNPDDVKKRTVSRATIRRALKEIRERS